MKVDRSGEFAAYPKRELTFARGILATLWDTEGNEYVDCGASFGVGNLGHCNPAIVEAIEKQARDLIHVGPTFGSTAKQAFIERLLSVAPPNLRSCVHSSPAKDGDYSGLYRRTAVQRGHPPVRYRRGPLPPAEE